MAGKMYDGLFCHEDILDLMYLLVSARPETHMKKFIKRHKIIAPACRMTVFLTQSTYLSLKTGKIFEIKESWKLEEAQSPQDLELLLGAKDKMLYLN
jgi:hypothetical protein